MSVLRGRLAMDLMAGMTCGVTVLPQGLAYATIVGLPAVYGLYCALVPPLVYFFLGASPHLIVGPTAVMSLMVGQAAAQATSQSNLPIETLAMIVSFSAGLVFVLLSLFRAGFVANFLSRPVVSGFTSAAGIIIGFEQLKNLLGIRFNLGHGSKHTQYFWEKAYEIFSHLEDINWWSTVLGFACIAMILLLKRFKATKLVPSALIAVVVGCLLAYFWDFESKGVELIGHVKPGFPPVRPPTFESFSLVITVFPTSVLIALVGFMEAYSIGKTFAVQGGYELRANQELFALGVSNLIGSFFSAYPATGSFSRTAVNYNVGATSGIANFSSAVVVLVTVLWLTELFFYLPKTCLAAIIISAVLNLFDYKEVQFLWRIKRRDLIVWVVTFGVTLGVGIELGIVSGLLASLVLVMWRMAMPQVETRSGSSLERTALLYPDDSSEVIGVGADETPLRQRLLSALQDAQSVERALSELDSRLASPEADDGVICVSMLESHLFMNAAVLKDAVVEAALLGNDRAEVPMVAGGRGRARVIVVDASLCNDIDSTAIHTLADAKKQVEGYGVDLLVGGARLPILEQLRASRLFPATRLYSSLGEAFEAARDLTRRRNSDGHTSASDESSSDADSVDRSSPNETTRLLVN
jgi:sulfate permease, SulP family